VVGENVLIRIGITWSGEEVSTLSVTLRGVLG